MLFPEEQKVKLILTWSKHCWHHLVLQWRRESHFQHFSSPCDQSYALRYMLDDLSQGI